MKRILPALVMLVGLLGTGHAGAAAQAPTASKVSPLASFGDLQIDLRQGWGAAKACASDGTRTDCFTSEAAMDEFLAAQAGATATASEARVGIEANVVVALSSCASSLRLYSGSNYGGTVLYLSTQFTVLSLSGYGFDNATSSYRVGGCSSTFYDGSSGSGSIYPGATWAWAQSASMVSGWDNRIGSVYIS